MTHRLVVLDNLDSLVRNVMVSELELFVRFLVWSRHTKAVDAVVHMRVYAPAKCAIRFNRKDRVARRQNGNAIVVRLQVKHAEARN